MVPGRGYGTLPCRGERRTYGCGIATQLITVGATLAGVTLTLVANAHLEGRRARDTRELEALRLASEHAKWLRDQRVKAYADLSLARNGGNDFLRQL